MSKEPTILTVWLDLARPKPDFTTGIGVIDFLLHVRTLQESGLLDMLDPLCSEIDADIPFLLHATIEQVQVWMRVKPDFAERLWRTRVSKTRWY